MKKFAWILLIAAVSVPFAPQALFADGAAVESKLQEISKKQDRILAELEALKSELNIVKIRVSSS